MAKSCPHPDHSEPNEKEKRKKNENEEKESSEENECAPHKTYQLHHLKHSWFEKGQDAVVVHIYMKQQSSELVGVDFQENSVEVKFRTSASDILKLHPGCDRDTLLTWNLFLRGKIDTSRSQCKVLKAMFEIQLKKKVPGRWGSLEMPSFLLKECAKVVMNGASPLSAPSVGAAGSDSVSKTATLPQTNGKAPIQNGGTAETVDAGNGGQEISPTTTNGLGECKTAVKDDVSNTSPKKTSVEGLDGASAIPQPPKPSPPPPPPLLTSTGVMGGSKGAYNGVRLMGDGQSSDNVASATDGDSSRRAVSNIKIGYTGLENLGNTCYLNSIVQCLVNTRKLRDYFLGGKYKQEINTENPLGTGGKLAMGFGSLMKNIWSGKEKHLAPQKLKMIVGEKVCQFRGFMQQDAQEFMAFLLDGLHEDLNRVKDKPYTEEVEGGGRPDTEVATEAWKRHKSRNDSVIVDLFQGQLKSKLTCPVCKKISITFDPFMNLSVPLPKEQKLLPVIVFFKDPSRRPLKVVVKVAQNGPIEQLTAAVERKTGISVNNMMVFEAFRGRFYRFFDKGYNMSTAVTSDMIIVAEVLSQEEVGEEVYQVPVIQRLIYPHTIPSHCGGCYRTPEPQEHLKRCAHCFSIGYCNQSCQKKHWPTHKKLCKRTSSYVGVPFVVSLPASKATFKALTEMAATYASYSVDVHPGVDTTQEPQPESDLSCKTRGESTRNDPTVCATRAQHSASSQSSSTSSDADPDTHPQFYFKPVSLMGDSLTGPEGVRLHDHGDNPLDLSDKNLSIDWRNHPRTTDFVTVSDKKLECEEDVSCQSEALPDSYSCTLQECLELFTEPETLSDTDAWYCPKCKKHREATKQMSVWRLPEVLVIHLKRFSFRNILFRDKITKLVDFPLRGLDISPYSLGSEGKESALYDLFAITNHSGTVNFGHYTSYGRLPAGTENDNGLKGDGLGWRYFDDRSVSPTSGGRVVSKYAYVLFYQKRAAAISALHPVNELKTKCNATNEQDQAEPAVLAEKTEQSSASVEEHSEVKEEAERISTAVVNDEDAVLAKTPVEHTSFNGNKPVEQDEVTPTQPVQQDEDRSTGMNLADVDENDLD